MARVVFGPLPIIINGRHHYLEVAIDISFKGTVQPRLFGPLCVERNFHCLDERNAWISKMKVW